MRQLTILLLIATACASTTPAPQPEAAPAPAETRPERSGTAVPISPKGASCRSAVVVNGADGRAEENEDRWIAENYPGAKAVKRTVADCNGKPADVVEIETANGQTRSIYFAPDTP